MLKSLEENFHTELIHIVSIQAVMEFENDELENFLTWVYIVWVYLCNHSVGVPQEK